MSTSTTSVSAPLRNRDGEIIKRPEYLPLSSLEDNSLYILTSRPYCRVRTRNFPLGSVHERRCRERGTKYHISNLSGQWIAKHGISKGICNEMRLIRLFCVASVQSSHREVDKLLRMEDGKVNDIEGQTCKTWLERAIERLRAAGLACGSWNELEKNVCRFRNEHWQIVSMNMQPRPTRSSHSPER